MLKRLFSLAAVLWLLAACMAHADEASIRKAVQAKFPQAEVQSVTKLPYLGLYEVVISNEILYTDENFDYIIYDGNIIETKTDRNLTAERKRKLAMIPFNELPLELAFKRVKGKGERKMAVFSDPDCPFCRRIEGDLAKLDNVTIYMFLFPIDGLHPQASDKAKRIWCSPDRAKAWDDYLNKGIAPTAAPTCDNPVDKLVEFGSKRGINATPTLVFANGDRVPGAISAAQIEKLLSGAKAN
ncbi:MAG TPA: DsbC family protein [Burkholderiales bacterium]|nr:DsbC family protein [Burkholderiales bacterium]